MEALLRELIETNKQILNEIRLLRSDLAAGQPLPAAPAEVASPPVFEHQDTAKTPPPRYSANDLEDLRGALMDGVKKQNKVKRDAYSEFEKLHKDW